MTGDRTILAVPGLSNTTPEFRAALWDMAARNGWNVDAIATVMSSESGFKADARNPSGSATGLIQIIDSTARSLGTTADDLRAMSAVQQLPYVERYYQRAGIVPSTRDFDYYVVGLGKRPGLSLDTQVVSNDAYAVNRGLDTDNDGRITVADMQTAFQRIQARAGGRRLDASPLAKPVSPRPVGPGSASWQLVSASLLSLCTQRSALNVLGRGARGPDVAFVQYLLRAVDPGLKCDGEFGPLTELALRRFQALRKVPVTGMLDTDTWMAFG